MQQNQSTLLPFLVELRSRLLRCFFVLCVFLSVLLYFADKLYTLLAQPLLKFLPQGHLIATQIVAPFFVPFKLALLASFLLTMPFFLYQLWAFAAPALYPHEKRFAWPLLFLSTLLFYAGMLFAYWVIFPLLFRFLTQAVPQGVTMSPDITQYLDFTLNMLLIFGVLFEIPIIMLLLALSGLVTRARFVKMRPYALVGAFILGMLLAPPDVLSQTILAVPIWLLFELGVLLLPTNSC